MPLVLQVYQATGKAVCLITNDFLNPSPMLFSFECYSKVSVMESLILKELALHRIKNFKFNSF